MSSHDVHQTTNNNMFTETEKNQLQTFLDDLETVDTDIQPKERKISNKPNTSKKRSEKKRMTPYPRKESVRSSESAEESSSLTTAKGGRIRKQPHELLSEEQKKANHIASEQKRRANIRIGFDQLVNTVPTLDTFHRSEAVILQKSVKYIKDLINDKNELTARLKELQTMLGEIPDDNNSEEGYIE
ncbi:MAG: hypothetical protein EXX96DRAFT_544998 [Benjaminiella poitrasii]|nr:MAG: hypothetical protein EXX96DRAFT_544998 [Benjaminiella poitrasii]